MELSLPTPRVALAGAGVFTGCACLVLAGHLLGARLESQDPRVHIGAPPLVGMFHLQVGARLLAPAALAAAAVLGAPAAARRLAWRPLLAATWVLAAARATLLG